MTCVFKRVHIAVPGFEYWLARRHFSLIYACNSNSHIHNDMTISGAQETADGDVLRVMHVRFASDSRMRIATALRARASRIVDSTNRYRRIISPAEIRTITRDRDSVISSI